MMSPSMSSSCSGRRTSTPCAPMPRRVVRCSLKSPWRPRTPMRGVVANELDRHAVLLGLRVESGVLQASERPDLREDRAEMAHGLDDVAGARFTLAADHRRAFVDAAERLAEIARAAHERHLEVVLLYVELLVCRRKNFALVDVVDTESFQHLSLDKVPDPALRHDRNGHGAHDLDDLLGI